LADLSRKCNYVLEIVWMAIIWNIWNH